MFRSAQMRQADVMGVVVPEGNSSPHSKYRLMESNHHTPKGTSLQPALITYSRRHSGGCQI